MKHETQYQSRWYSKNLALSVCEYLFTNLNLPFSFLTVNVSETVEQLKKYMQSLTMSFDVAFKYFSKATNNFHNCKLCLVFSPWFFTANV